jgi:cytochrome c oxidase subunit 1
VPVVESRSPLWELGDEMPVATGLATDKREVLVTTALDAIPDSRHEHPGESHWPLVMAIAIGVTFIGAVWTPWAYVIGFLISTIAFAGWGWPRGTKPDDEVTVGRVHGGELR